MNFIIGPPGSGKTTWCLEHVREKISRSPFGPPIILLVPEQMSYSTEHALLSDAVPGTVRARVFSFSRLQKWVFAQSPVTSLPQIDEVHRRVLVTRVVSDLRRNSGEGLLHVQSIERAVADFIAEMKQFRVTPAAMVDIADEVRGSDPRLAGKLDELARVAIEYDRMTRGKFEEPEDSLATLRERLAGLDALQGAEVFVDGFYGFTPVELEVLNGLVRRCTDVTFTLTIDKFRFDALRTGGRPSEFSRAYLTEETVPVLLALAADCGVKINNIVAMPARDGKARFKSKALAHLQKYFRADQHAAPFDSATTDIAMRVAASERGEARRAVETLLEWREHRGWNWRDMAIVTRNIDSYAQPLVEFLRAAGIPFFLDRREPLETHPLVQGTIAALECVLAGWKSETILEFAKSGLYPFDSDDVALLQRFVGSYPQRSSRWHAAADWQHPPVRSPFEDDAAWRATSFDMDEINKIRRAIMEPLTELDKALAEACTDDGCYPASAFIEALCRLIYHATGTPDEATEQVLEQIGGLFESILAASGTEAIPGGVLLDIVRESLATLTLPRIPPVLDQVVIAQIDRSRISTVKGAIVLGLAEGRFPHSGTNASLLTDRERDELVRLAEKRPVPEFRASTRRMFLRESFFAWMAMTRASEALELLRPLSDSSGQRLAPSDYWNDVQRLFPSIAPVEDHSVLAINRAIFPAEAAAAICRDLFATTHRGVVPPPINIEQLAGPLTGDARRRFVQVIRSAGRRNEARINPALAREAIGDTLRTSVSALESLASCPFQHFMRGLIAPEIVETPTVGPGDTGNLIHAVMKSITDHLISDGRTFAQLDRDSIKPIVEQAFEKPLERLRACGLYETEGEQASLELMKRQAVELVEFLAEASAQLQARPLHTEFVFGRRDAAGGLKINVELEGGATLPVVLRGQIDRIDVLEVHGRKWLAVFDYKLNEKKPEWPQLKDGRSLQLPVYLLVLKQLRNSFDGLQDAGIAGAFYIPVVWPSGEMRCLRGVMPHDLWDELGLEHIVGKPVLSASKNPGEATGTRGDVISARQFERLLEKAEGHLRRLAARVASGDVRIEPAWVGKISPCGYCQYSAACRLDYMMNSRRVIPGGPRNVVIESWLGAP